MTALRTAAQQALERLRQYHYGNGFAEDAKCIADLEAALAQQAEPAQESSAYSKDWCLRMAQIEMDAGADFEIGPALAQQAEPVQEPAAGRAFLERILAAMEGVLDVADRKTDEFDALRSCVIDLTVMLHAAPPQQVAQQAEPLNLSDPAVQKRLATQWGYVPAAQAEPVEPVAWYQKRGQEVFTWPHPACWGQEDKPWTPLYTAPPQRKPLPKHDQHCVDVPGYGLMAVRLVRAVERAHGIT